MNLRTAATAAALAASAIVLFAACDSDEPEPPPTRPADGIWVIDQDDLAFKPSEITVAADETVRFTNSETAIHTVTIDGDDVSGDMHKDDVFEWSPPGPGEFEVTCDLHPQMRATITVQ